LLSGAHDQREERQLKRGRIALEDEAPHRLLKFEGLSEIAAKNISFEDFQRVLEESQEVKVTMKGFRSLEHRIFTEVIEKRALNGLDTKRFATDSINTLAFGHRGIVN